MARTARAKTVAKPAAQSRAEAEAAIARIGVAQRELARIEADLGDLVAKAKEIAELRAAPHSSAIEADQALVQGWCEANRDALTNNGKVKFASLATGDVKWRARPPKVNIRNVEGVIAHLRGLKLRQFLRTKIEVNKDAMLADPDKARTVPGVSINSDGEDFVIEPFDAALSEVA